MTESASEFGRAYGRGAAQSLVVDQVLAFIRSRALYVAAKLGVADLLRDGPLDVATLATRVGADGPSLRRVLRLLARMGIFEALDGDRYQLNEAAELLTEDSPQSMRAMAVYYGQYSYPAWGEVLHAVRTGGPAFEQALGADCWTYQASDPEAGALFNGAMQSGAVARGGAVCDLPWQGDETVVDLGGGNGTLLIELLTSQPGLTGIVVDGPTVVAQATERIAEAGLSDRCTAVAGDLFGEFPPHGDVYIMSIVLHDWDDGSAVRILENVRRRIRDNARLLLVEHLLDEQAPLFDFLIDLHMMVETGGRERTEADWRTLLTAGGFDLTQIHHTPKGTVLEGVGRSSRAANPPVDHR